MNNDHDDIPDFPPSQMYQTLPSRGPVTLVGSDSRMANIAFNEMRIEMRTVSTRAGVILEVAHHFYKDGVLIVRGNWTSFTIPKGGSNYICVRDVEGTVKARC